jgi:hypothetical protein
LQISLIQIGAETLAEDAGYSIDAEGESAAKREAKRMMCDALDKMDRTVGEIKEAMTAARAEQELPESVASLTRYRRRRAG